MIDLHTHTLFSDGTLLPSELVYRAKVKGYDTMAITDHGDFSTLDFVIPRIVKISKFLSDNYSIKVIPGIELTYVPPKLISKAVKISRKLGARIVLVHGETPAETVPEDTNLYGVKSGADILAHPGHITADVCRLAKSNNVCLEITTRHGHSKTNAHVAKTALKTGAKLILNTDSHMPEDLLDKTKIAKALKSSKLSFKFYEEMKRNSYEIQKLRG